MEALHNFINALVQPAKRAQSGVRDTSGTYASSCGQLAAQQLGDAPAMMGINKGKNTDSGFSMPYIKENMLQTLIM